MNTATTTPHRVGWLQLLIMAWALTTFLVSLLPEGMGDDPRALNALVFLCVGPGCALLGWLMRSMPPSVAGVVALGSSLAILVLSSQILLLVDAWRAWAVTAIVAIVTVALALLPRVYGDNAA